MNHIWESQQSPQTSPSRASYGVPIVWIFKKIDCVITAPHCIFQAAVESNLSNVSITLREPSNHLIATHSTAKFLISMENTNHHGTHMELNFGDGITKKYLIWPTGQARTSSLHVPDVMYLAASYGYGCLLQVTIEHVYSTQGIFRPSLSVSNNVTELHTHLRHTIEVLNQLQHAQLHGPTAAELNQLVNLSVTFVTSSLNISYFWSIINAQHKEVYNITTPQPTISHRFAKPGSHSVRVRATNRHGSVSATLDINVQIRLVNLSLALVPRGTNAVATRRMVTFLANLSAGSDVKFEWNFNDPHNGNTVIADQNLTSQANHTFLVSGRYPISVTARNLINQLITVLPNPLHVQDPILSLDVDVASPVILGSISQFTATVATGSSVHFDIDLGQGRQRMTNTSAYRAHISHEFPSIGSYNVTVHAFNNVSQLHEVVTVDVQEGITDVLITQYIRGVKNEPSIFVARFNGLYLIITVKSLI